MLEIKDASSAPLRPQPGGNEEASLKSAKPTSHLVGGKSSPSQAQSEARVGKRFKNASLF